MPPGSRYPRDATGISLVWSPTTIRNGISLYETAINPLMHFYVVFIVTVTTQTIIRLCCVHELLCLQPVCSVVRQWSETVSGRRRLRMSSGCSSRYHCRPGWTSWPYIDNNRYSRDDDSRLRYSRTYRYRFRNRYKYITTHQTCVATSCQPPTGILLSASLSSAFIDIGLWPANFACPALELSLRLTIYVGKPSPLPGQLSLFSLRGR